MKTTIKYITTKNYNNINYDKLSNQLQLLIDTINNYKIDGPTASESIFDREVIYSEWLIAINSDSNEKVFASYIHQLIQFDFIDRLDTKPKMQLTDEQLKNKIKNLTKNMTKEEIAELLN